MPSLTPELFVSLMSRLAEMDGILCGAGDALAASAASYEAEVLASGQRGLVHTLLPAKSDLLMVDGNSLSKSYLYRVLLGYTGPIRDCLIPGVDDPLSFALYYNTGEGGGYKCLLPAAFSALYTRIVGKAFPASCIQASPALLGSRRVGQPFSPGTTPGIDPALYAGADKAAAVLDTGAVFTSSRAAAANLVVVTGDARDSTGEVQTDREFTATFTAGQSIFPLVPTEAGDLLLNVKAIVLPSNMTAGTVSIENTN
jgi:hypothetical protein